MLIGISGKRFISAEKKQPLTEYLVRVIHSVKEKKGESEMTAVCSLAIGADTLFAEVACTVFNLPLKVILPMPVEEYRKDFQGKDLAVFNDYLSKAVEVLVLSGEPPKSPEQRSLCYFNAGKYIADHCDEMVFVWDEQKPKGLGGTADILGYYSEKKGICPVDYFKVPSARTDSAFKNIVEAYDHENSIAIQNRNKHQLIWKLALGLGWIAVLIFGINLAFQLKGIWEKLAVSLELLLVLLVFFIILRARKRDFHGNYLSHRLKAEKLRILKYYYHANVPVQVSSMTHQNDQLFAAIVNESNSAVEQATYHSKWFSNYTVRSLIVEQLEYHKRRASLIGNKYHVFESINQWIAILFLLNLVLHVAGVIFHLHVPFYDHRIITLLSVLLPASYATIEGILYFQDWGLLKKYSKSVEESLRDCLEELPDDLENRNDVTCSEKQVLTLHLVSSTMLTDNKSWEWILEDKHNYHLVV